MICPPKIGEIVEGKVINRDRSSLFLDLDAKGIGVIYGQEFFAAKETLKDLKPGDSLSAKVVNLETEDGFRELSLTEAREELAWEELRAAKEQGETFEIPIKGANKGGVICMLKGIAGFVPTSQLLPAHYPKVEGADPAKISHELQKLLGEKLQVKVFSVDPRERKLILSEKLTEQQEVDQELISCKIGEEVEGQISGVTNFGAFLKFGKNLEGLINASEIAPAGDKSPTEVLKIGDKLKAKIIKIEGDRIYLSIQRR